MDHSKSNQDLAIKRNSPLKMHKQTNTKHVLAATRLSGANKLKNSGICRQVLIDWLVG